MKKEGIDRIFNNISAEGREYLCKYLAAGDQNATDIADLKEKIAVIQLAINQMTSTDPDNPTINTLTEVYNFLNSAKDTETIDTHIQPIPTAEIQSMFKEKTE